MTDSVWWYVLAGFLLGFILSTLWEWLYFRRRRMQIESRRIAELEATVRSLSTVSQSVETNTSPGFAAGYQGPMVFLEGEDDDVDTVEVIVPAPPEPVEFDQSIASQVAPIEQPPSDTQFVSARSESVGRAPSSNGNGVPNQAPGQAAKVEPAAVASVRVDSPTQPAQSALSPAALAAGTAAAAAIWARDKDRPPVAPDAQEQPFIEAPPAQAAAAESSAAHVTEIPVADIPVADTPVTEPPVSETIVYGVPPMQPAEEQPAEEQPAEEQPAEGQVQEPIPGLVGDLAPGKQINYVTSTTGEVEPGEVDRVSAPGAAVALASAEPFAARQTVPLPPQDEVVTIEEGAIPESAATSMDGIQPTAQEPKSAAVNVTTATTDSPPAGPAASAVSDPAAQVTVQPVAPAGQSQPVSVQPVPSQLVQEQPDRQKPDEDSGLSPAGVAVLVSTLASKLAGEQQRPPEASQQPSSAQSHLRAEPQSEPQTEAQTGSQAALSPEDAPVPNTIPESAPAARVMPVVYEVPGTAADPENAPPATTVIVTPPAVEQKTDPATQPEFSTAVQEAKADGPVSGAGPTSAQAEELTGVPAAPQDRAAQGQDAPLPLSAILPRAAKPAPLSKSPQAKRLETVQPSALAASGIEPEIEQVSNQLDDLIDSLNGLIEQTQPLLDQQPPQAQPVEPPAAPAPFAPIGDDSAGEEPGTDEEAGISGPYSAQNLSRMEYGLVQLMQAARRLGRDVRSAF